MVNGLKAIPIDDGVVFHDIIRFLLNGLKAIPIDVFETRSIRDIVGQPQKSPYIHYQNKLDHGDDIPLNAGRKFSAPTCFCDHG